MKKQFQKSCIGQCSRFIYFIICNKNTNCKNLAKHKNKFDKVLQNIKIIKFSILL